MNKQDQAFNRLLKKLSALRATLKSDERNLLDGLVTGPIDEVGAHAMNVTPISPARNTTRSTAPDEARAHTMKISTAKNTTRSTAPDEARAHTMKISTAKNTTRATSPDEARAHSMKISTAKNTTHSSAPDEARAHLMSIQIIYDQTKDEYQRIH